MFTLGRLLVGGTLTVIALGAIAAASWWFFIREDNELATEAPAIPTELACAGPNDAPTGSPVPGRLRN